MAPTRILDMLPTHCILAVRNYGKGIPYHGVTREDGGTNHGFRLLKGKPRAEAASIPEAHDNPSLQEFLVRINAAETSLFSVGCEKALIHDDLGHRMKGYVEFAINDRVLAAGAQHYFKIFFDFSQQLHSLGFQLPIQFGWEIEGALFEATNSGGHTVTVWIQTADNQSSPEMARKIWSEALHILTDFLCSIGPPAVRNPIY